jgi:hypothetical protein
MSMARRGVYAVLAALLLAALAAPLRAEAQDDFYGVWSGQVTEVIVGGRRYASYEVNISLVPGEYRVEYPTLGCGGQLHLLGRQGGEVRFRDELGYGRDHCSDGGRTELRFISPQLRAYLWFDAKGVLKAEGVLKRQVQMVVNFVKPQAMIRGKS